jgi:predicted TIM-barrel fold metal-dependent hydrolase
MHLHAYPANGNGPPGQMVCPGVAAEIRFDPGTSWPQKFTERMFSAECESPIIGAMTDDEVRDQTIAALRRYNARGVLSGSPEALDDWMQIAPDLFFPGPNFRGRDSDPNATELGAQFETGELEVFAEITAQYLGILADDDRLTSYWDMAAALDIPVGIHMGVGPPGAYLLGAPDFVVQSPMHLEPILKTYPTLRVYVMHGGMPYVEDMKALMYAYPQLHLDTGVLQMAMTREAYYAYLQDLVAAGFVDRIMFGSDQMNWPGLIGEGIDAINDAPFLTYEQKKMILHDNAARFLRLSDTSDPEIETETS